MSGAGTRTGKAYFVGIAGMGMAPLAIYAKGAGWQVSGCDDSSGALTLDALARAGIDVYPPQVLPEDTDLMVISSAIGAGHPLRRQAARLGIETIRRGEFLALLAADRRLLAVVGSHGKTTTCGMLIDCLSSCGVEFGYVLGGLFADPALLPARWSAGQWLIAEVDESDGTIEAFAPELTLVVNLDWDHPDRYPDEAAMTRAFRDVVVRTAWRALLPEDCAPQLFGSGARPDNLRTFGAGGDYAMTSPRADGCGWQMDLGGLFPARTVTLPVGGLFNAHNAGAALAACLAVSDRVPDRPLAGFGGIFRRQELLFADDRRMVIADYAHHPNEVSELIRYLRQTFPGRLRVVFQPHRYSRTRQYAGDFAKALRDADEVVLLPVYAAAEQPLAGGQSSAISSRMDAAGDAVTLCPDPVELSCCLPLSVEGEREVIAFIGAGDINEVAVEWLAKSLGVAAERRTLWL